MPLAPSFEVAPPADRTRQEIERLLLRPFRGAAKVQLGRKGPGDSWHARVDLEPGTTMEVGETFDVAQRLAAATEGAAAPVFYREAEAPPEGTPPPVNWQRSKCEFPEGADGRGIVIAHPDTGYTLHHELEVDGDRYRESAGKDYVDGGPPEAAPGTAFYSHGTGIGSVLMSGPGGGGADDVVGAAYGATLVPYRASPTVILWRRRYRKNLAKAILHAVRRRADVISISMGWFTGHDDLAAAVQAAEEAGVIVVAAAGQLGHWTPGLRLVAAPARYDTVVAAAACDAEDNPCRWSARGRKVQITAPGEGIHRAHWKDGAAEVGPSYGTSYAAAITAGAAALWLQRWSGHERIRDRTERPGLFRAALAQCADPLGPDADEGYWGAGRLNVRQLLALGPDHVELDVRRTSPLRSIDELSALLTETQPSLPWRAALPAILDAEYQVRDLDAFVETHGQELMLHAAYTPGTVEAFETRWEAVSGDFGVIPESYKARTDPLIPGASSALTNARRR